MTGTTGDIIAIVIVPVVVLAFWIAMMYYADSHPRWGSQAAADTVSANAVDGSAQAQRLINPGPVVPGQRTGIVANEVTPEQVQASAAPR
jgi:uncharacterized protein (UPF0333 family)